MGLPRRHLHDRNDLHIEDPSEEGVLLRGEPSADLALRVGDLVLPLGETELTSVRRSFGPIA